MITWDDQKSRLKLRHHKLDFKVCEAVFDHPVVTIEDARLSYGEQRINLLGRLAERVVHMTCTERAENLHVISCGRQPSMKPSTTTSKSFPKSSKEVSTAIAAAPERIHDPDCPYDPSYAAAVETFWKNATVRRPAQRGPGRRAKKVLLSVRYSPEVVAYFKSTGEGWQTRMDEALKEWVASRQPKPRKLTSVATQALSLNLSETDKARSYWVSRPYVADSLRTAIQASDILLIPEEGIRDIQDPLFPSGTEAFFRYLRDNAPRDMVVEICVSDERYQELSLNFDLVMLGSILVTSLALPVIKDLIAGYLKERLGKKRGETAQVQVSIKIEAGERTFSFDYKGPVSKLEDAVEQTGKLLAPQNSHFLRSLPEEDL